MKFEDLEVWKRSSRLCADLYKHFQDIKDFGFRDQITRSALSI
ncbi:MAG: four helix bundle protein, partial [Desulfobacteraceae bacterium]|nr:four helix bundle protein [Desulfobacteraceae bacterium]